MKSKKTKIKELHEEARQNWFKLVYELKQLDSMNRSDKLDECYEKVCAAEARFLALDEVVAILGL